MAVSTGYIKSLEGFRGLCILLVLLHNLFPYQLPTSGLIATIIREIANSGWVGVQWFFVLSGFLITRILLAQPKQLSAIKNFYARRCLRIFPLYYLTLFVLLIILPLLGLTYPGTHEAIEHSGWFWLYASNLVSLAGLEDIGLSHFWSLAVEEQFYLIWPWLIIFFAPNKIKLLCLSLIISAPLIRGLIAFYYPKESDTWNYVLTCVRWDALGAGALLAYLSEQDKVMDVLGKFLSAYITFFTLWFITVVIHYTDFKAVGSGVLVLNQTLAALVGAVFIFVCIRKQKTPYDLIKNIFENKILCHFGKYSYAIYIFHLIVAVGVLQYRESIIDFMSPNVSREMVEVLLLTITLLIIYLLARASWLLIELPFLKLKHNF